MSSQIFGSRYNEVQWHSVKMGFWLGSVDAGSIILYVDCYDRHIVVQFFLCASG